MKYYLIFLSLILIFQSTYGQIIKNEDLLGKWEINDLKGAHKAFRVVFTFEKLSVLREDINEGLVSYEIYRLTSFRDQSALVFINADTAVQEAFHPLTLKGDTLTIGNFYYPYKEEYRLRKGDSIYFIRSRIP